MPNPENRGKLIEHHNRRLSPDALPPLESRMLSATLEFALALQQKLGHKPTQIELDSALLKKAQRLLRLNSNLNRVEYNFAKIGVEVLPPLSLKANGQILTFSPREYDLVLALAKKMGEVVSREELQQLKPESYTRANNLNRSISTIRYSLDTFPVELPFDIVTIKFQGYMMEKINQALPLDQELYPPPQSPAA